MIVEEKTFDKGLMNAGLDENGLLGKLKGQDLQVKDVFFAMLNSDGTAQQP